MSAISLYFLFLAGILAPVLSVRSYFKLKAGAPFPSKSRLTRQIVVMELVFLAFSLLVWRDTGMTLFPRHFPQSRDWGVGALVLIVFVAFMYPIWRHNARTQRERVYKRMPTSEAELPMWSVLSLLAGTVEEITYRGVLFGILFWWLEKWWVAAVLCALSFALGHAIQGWKGTLIIFGMSLIFQGLVRFTGSLYVAMAVHTVFDVVAGFAYLHFYRSTAELQSAAETAT